MRPKDAHLTAWDQVRELIDTGDVAKVVAAVTALDDAGRREVARELPGYITVAREKAYQPLADYEADRDRVRQARQTELQRLRDAGEIAEYQYDHEWAMTWHDNHWLRGPSTSGWIEPMRVAGAGTIGGAAAVVAWINRREFERWDLAGNPVVDEIEPLLKVITARPADWQADLAVRLTLRIRPRRRRNPSDQNLPPALALLRHTGVTPPAHDPLVVGWVSREANLSELRTDPLLSHLLPRIFEADGVGRALRDERSDPAGPTSWLGALHTLAAEGRVHRELLLDGCRRRFLLGGEGPDLRFFARLHELLKPTPTEIEPHAIDYLRLLPTAPGPVAELALKHLRRLTGLDPADVVEALEGLLFRAEGGLVRTGLSWLEESVRQTPDHADALAPALTMAFGHQARAVQERAVHLTIRHAAHFTPLGAETLRHGTATLAPDLHNRLTAAIGGERVEEPDPEPEPEEELFVPQPLPVPPRPRPADAPPHMTGQLADLYLRDDWRSAERCLAAFVRLAAQDRESLRAGLAPLVEGAEERLVSDEWKKPDDWMIAFAVELADPGRVHDTRHSAFVRRRRHERGRPPVAAEEINRLPERRRASPLHRFILHRYEEILTALRAGSLPPLLLATPSLSNGQLDPAELVTRLEALEAAGVAPLPADFQQALLRLPRRIDPWATERAANLSSEAGRRAARWMADGGLPDPTVKVTWSGKDNGLGSRIWMTSTVQAAPTGLPLIDELLADQPRNVNLMDGHLGGLMEWWAAVLPSHREVVAAHLLPHQPMPTWSAAMHSSRLADLAAAEGPAGQAVAVLLAHRIFPTLSIDDTAPALLALRRLAAAGEFPAEDFGAELAQRVLRGEITLRLLVDTVEGEAASGAHHHMWRALTVALPLLLPAPGTRSTNAHTDLVALAARLARWSEARGEIPALAAFAARKGSSRILRHARVLHDLLVPQDGSR